MLITSRFLCDTISASYNMSVPKDISMVDLYSDNMHNAPFMHLKHVSTNTNTNIYMSIYGTYIQILCNIHITYVYIHTYLLYIMHIKYEMFTQKCSG